MDTITSTLATTEQTLLKQPFFAIPQTRTISRIVAWVEKTLSAPSVTKTKTELEHYVATYPSHDEGVRQAATQLLRASGLLRVEEVRDIESCAEHLGTWVVDGVAPVLTDEVITTALDAVPGGHVMLASHTPEEIRHELLRLGFGPSQTGHELARPFLEKNECAPGALDAANRIFCDPSRYLGVLMRAIANAMTSEERLQLETLYNQLGVIKPLPALVAPRLTRLRPFLISYVEERPPGLETALGDDLLTVFAPTENYTRPDRNYGDQRLLMTAVYDDLIECTLLAAEGFSADKNRQRVLESIDGLELNVDDLRHYPKLYRLCRATKTTYRPKIAPKSPEAIYPTLAAGYAALERCAKERGVRRGKRLVLPTRPEFTATATKPGQDPAASLELQTGLSYQAIIAQLAEKKGYALPGRSEPHRVMNRLVVDALSDWMIDEPKDEYTNPELFARQRIDLFVRVACPSFSGLLTYAMDLCFEADGAQHFTNVDYWGGSSKNRDRMKARRVLAVAKTRPMSLISLHHEILTGAKAKLLSSSDLVALVECVATNHYPWVFVRPRGSSDMRATPRDVKPMPLTGVITNQRLEVFVLPSVD